MHCRPAHDVGQVGQRGAFGFVMRPVVLDGVKQGEVVEFWSKAAFTVKSQDKDHPFYVGAYMTGGNDFLLVLFAIGLDLVVNFLFALVRQVLVLVQDAFEQEVGVAAQENVGAAARHVGGDGDRAPLAGAGDDLRLVAVTQRTDEIAAVEGIEADRLRDIERLTRLALEPKPLPEGFFAAAQALKALKHGLHVFLFSDNVSLEDEIALKKYARDHGLLLMGPGAGTTILNNVALGFANVLPRGPVGIVSAAGTGLQEVSTLLARHGVGISQGLGTGGRDLKKEVGGIMMLEAFMKACSTLAS